MATPNYSTRADVVLAAGGVERLVQLTDYDNSGEEDTDLVNDALCEAEGVIDSYLRKRFEVPLQVVPELVRRTAANMAVHVLKSRRDAITEKDVLEQEQRIKWLEGIKDGSIDPGVSPKLAKSPHNNPVSSERPSSKAVSRENLKGFS